VNNRELTNKVQKKKNLFHYFKATLSRLSFSSIAGFCPRGGGHKPLGSPQKGEVQELWGGLAPFPPTGWFSSRRDHEEGIIPLQADKGRDKAAEKPRKGGKCALVKDLGTAAKKMGLNEVKRTKIGEKEKDCRRRTNKKKKGNIRHGTKNQASNSSERRPKSTSFLC